MSVKTLSGELEQEYYHLLDRLGERVDSLGLDPDSEEVQAELSFWFGADIAINVGAGA